MKTATRQTVTYFAAFFILGATMASLGPTLLYIASNTGSSLESLGLLFTLRSGGYLLGSLISGRLYDRLPGNSLLGIAIIAGALNLAFIPQISSFAVIIAVMLLVGLAESTLDVGSNTQMVWLHGPRSGPYLNGMFLFAGVGGMLSPLLLSSIDPAAGYRIMALVSLPVAMWAFLTPSPPRVVPEEHRSGSSLPPVQLIASWLLTFIFVGGEVGFSGWVYSYAYELGLGTQQTVGRLTSFYWLGITLGRVAAIFVSARYKPRRIVLANLAGLILSFGLILIDPASRGLLWIGTFGVGFFLAPVFPTTFAYLEQKTPITGTAAGVLWASGSFGAMVFPWLMGLQMGQIGPVSIMVTLAVSFGISLLLFAWVFRR